MKSTTAIRIAGGFNAFFFFFHVPFYWMLDWQHSLSCLNRDNWAIFQCFNIISIVLLGFMSYISLFLTCEVASTRVGKTMLVFASWFYAFRIAAEFVFFDEQPLQSILIVVLCAVPATFYAAPLFINNKR